VVLLAFPFALITLGLFRFVVNAARLGINGLLVPGFFLADFGFALFCSFVASITGVLASWYIGFTGTAVVRVVE